MKDDPTIRPYLFAAVGLLMAKWAQQESAFLSRPDPEGPPKIFKE